MLHDVPRILAAQHTLERLDRSLAPVHRILGSVEMTQAGMKTLCARTFRSEGKGRDV